MDVEARMFRVVILNYGNVTLKSGCAQKIAFIFACSPE